MHPPSKKQKTSASSLLTGSTGNCYEVFLSFRGPDTRHGFTDHLYHGLLGAGIDVFRDIDDLREGENIRPELLTAITKSKILIPILSENYGASGWCLDELVQIMECKKNTGQIVLPVFYKVKPAEVQHQIGSFGDAFREREGRLRARSSFDPAISEKWKKALAEVSTLKGYEADGYEGALVKSIIQKVLSELKKEFELVIPENLVGIDDHVQKLMKLVDNNSSATLFVGICGMGGIGKTTLAKTIYNKISNQFEHRSFIPDIRESCRRNGLDYLQNQLISDVFKQNYSVSNKDDGINFISSKFKDKKVLILVDDVDDHDQLKALVGNHNWFSSGSRILITTRNSSILDNLGVDHKYEHEEMDKNHSMILFSRHAFRRSSPPTDFEVLARDVVTTTGGLPLSLEVLGSFLCGRERKVWRATIDKLKKAPHQKVREKLRISYEELDDGQKQIFLDIACFFIGYDTEIVSYMWDASGFFPGEGIEVLRFMSLIKIGDDNELQMHDQLRDLGREIVREENQREPQYRSRLWDFKEAQKVLKDNKGTDKIEAINLGEDMWGDFGEAIDLGEYMWGDFGKPSNIYTEKQFKNLLHLRYLNLTRAHLRGDFKDSMKELKWLQWPGWSMNFEVKNFHAEELVVLDMSSSKIDGKWEGWSCFMTAEKLKFLDLSKCYSLEDTGFLSAFKNLEVLILNSLNLERIDSSIGDMEALRRLELCQCKRLGELPAEIGRLKALEQLRLNGNKALSALPDSILFLENLEILNLSGSSINRLPIGFWRLRKLRELHTSLRGKIVNPSSLQRLDVYGCYELQPLPYFPPSLTDVNVICQSLELPSLSDLSHLKELGVSYCRSLKCIQVLPSVLPEFLNTPFKLKILEVKGCDSIETLDVSQFLNLRKLSVKYCSILLEVRGLDKLIYLKSLTVKCCGFKWLDLPNSECLKTLELCNCNDLTKIHSLEVLKFLQSANISGCISIERLDLLKSRSLKTLYVKSCKKLAEIQGLDNLEFLEVLDISECTLIERLLLPKSKSLKELDAGGCENLAEIQGLDRLEFLESLNISRCTSIVRLLLPKSWSLKTLYAKSCKRLVEIQGLDKLDFLEELDLSECTSIERLDLSKSKKLRKLKAGGCKKLAEIQGLNGLEFLRELYIKGCISIERLDLPKFGKLNELNAGDCENLVEIRDLDRSEFLQSLNISGCISIERLDLPKSKSLEKLDAESCKKLAEIQGLDRLEFLEVLHIKECTSIERLDLQKSRRLRKLDAGDCENLVEIQGLNGLELLQSLDVSGCTSIKELNFPKFYRLKNFKKPKFRTLIDFGVWKN